MATSFDVKLARHMPVRFPDRCVVCGTAHPGASVNVSSGILRWSMLIWPFSGRFSVRAPICQVCLSDFRRSRYVRSLIEWSVTAVCLLAAFWMFNAYDGPFRKWVIILTAIVLIVPYAIWATSHPLAFDVTATRDSVTYEFADDSYAEEFARENHRHLV